MRYDQEFINGLGTISRRARRPDRGKTKGKTAAKSATGKQDQQDEETKNPKDIYYKKRDYPFQSVDSYSESVKFIRRFVNLTRAKIEVHRLVAFIRALQRAIVSRLITKKSPHSRYITHIQEIAIDAYKHSRGNFVFIELDEKLRDKYYAIGRGEKVRGSISILKRFVSLIGLNVSDTKKRITSILKSLEYMYKHEIIKKNDPYYEKVKDAELAMKKALRENSEVAISNSALNGIHGVIQYEESGSDFFDDGGADLNGIENAETEIVELSDDQQTVPAVLTGEELNRLKFDSISLKGFYGELLAKPERNFFMCVYGKPWNGKSAFVVGLSKCYAEDVGGVAYISFEQHGTLSQQLLIRTMDAYHTTGLSFFRDFEAAGDLRKYSCIVIDSGTSIGLSLYDALEIKKMIPNAALIVILQTTKEGDLKGEQGWRHIPDIVLKVEDKQVQTEKNRYRSDPVTLPIPIPETKGEVPEAREDQHAPQQVEGLNGSEIGRTKAIRENEIEITAQFDASLQWIAENLMNNAESVNIGSNISKKPSKYEKIVSAVALQELNELGTDVKIIRFKFSHVDKLNYHTGTAYFNVLLRGTPEDLHKVAGSSRDNVFIFKWEGLNGEISEGIPDSEIVFEMGTLKSFDVPEMKLKIVSKTTFDKYVRVSKDAEEFIRLFFDKDELEIREQFWVLFLNRRCRIIGYYNVSIGGTKSTTVDPKLIFSVALKCLCNSIILVHNHPSGELRPSEQDIRLTKIIKEGGQLLDINVMDHVIMTPDSYFSFADDGLLGLH